MKKELVRKTVNLGHLPPLTEKQRAELEALQAREIDYSDIPRLTEQFWTKAEQGTFYKPTKASTTVRIDSDVLAWLRAQGRGYQTRMNAILRREMLASVKGQGSR